MNSPMLQCKQTVDADNRATQNAAQHDACSQTLSLNDSSRKGQKHPALTAGLYSNEPPHTET